MPVVPPGPGHSEAPRSSLSESRALSAFAERNKHESSVSRSTQLHLTLQHEFASFYHCAPGKDDVYVHLSPSAKSPLFL